MTTQRQRIEFWEERGAADALLRLFVPPGASRPMRELRINGRRVSYRDATTLAGISRAAAEDAVHRHRRRLIGPRSTGRRVAPGPAPAGTKWCGACERFHPFDEFSPNRSATTGLQSWCRMAMVYARREQRARASRRSAA